MSPERNEIIPTFSRRHWLKNDCCRFCLSWTKVKSAWLRLSGDNFLSARKLVSVWLNMFPPFLHPRCYQFAKQKVLQLTSSHRVHRHKKPLWAKLPKFHTSYYIQILNCLQFLHFLLLIFTMQHKPMQSQGGKLIKNDHFHYFKDIF